MERREFIASTMGMATSLSVLNMVAGCGDENGMMHRDTRERLMEGQDRASYEGGPSSAPTTRASGRDAQGGYAVDQEICLNEQMADRLFKSDYFILDFQTHHTRDGMRGLCLTQQPVTPECTSPDTYIRQIFEESETTVAVLSGLPASIDEVTNDLSPFSFTNEDMRNSRDRVNKASKLNPTAGERMLAHCQISPKNKPDANARMMETNKRTYDTRGWKCYPPTEGGWFLHENDAFIQTAIDLGEPLVCAHKGFPFQGWSRKHADPGPDVAEVAKRYPGVTFVIYHSAFDSAHIEGPYDPNPNPENGGTDRLAKVVSENGLSNKNVYAEMGSAWAIAMRDPVQAQHYVGKMLKYVGVDRLVWGSECVWYGCPQNQIEAFKAFRISEEFQEKYGYPEFTDQLKRKVFGLTGAQLYRVDPAACRYAVSRSTLATRRQLLDDRWGARRHAIVNPPAIRTRRDFLQLWRERVARGEFA
ncbi:MAG: amidohydrolase family protein [Polyangiales bacterium]